MYATADRAARSPAPPSGLVGRLAGLKRHPTVADTGELHQTLVGVLPPTRRWGVGLAAIGGGLVLAAATAALRVGSAASWYIWPALAVAGAFFAVAMALRILHSRVADLLGSLAAYERREADLADEREELLHEALITSDRERQRLAGDLHDGVTQLVSAVALRTATLSRGLRRDGGASPERLASVAVSLDRMTDDLRAATAELRTLMGALVGGDIDSDGLAGALSQLLAPLADSGVNVEVTVGELDCSARVRSLIHRVAQELVRNSAKHSQARRVTLSVERNTSGILLRVVDDGRGFDRGGLEQHHRQGHMGLRLLEQRVRDAGGRLDISSSPGRGTTVEMTVPIPGPRSVTAKLS
jgi:signal transduction histidine kinase